MAYEENLTDYFVLEAEKASLLDLLRIFYSTELEKRDFFDCPARGGTTLASFRQRWLVFVSVSAQKLLLLFKVPMARIGSTIQLLLNYPTSNGGCLQLLVNVLKGRHVRPDESSATYRSLIGNLDTRVELDESIKKGGSRYDAALCVMAAKLSYENEAFARTVVRDHWQMEFLNFYNFWNDYQEQYSTQAIIIQDKSRGPDDNQVVVVAFRGTEPFNADDWRTDVDLSWYELQNLGKIHAGFMKALGLQKNRGWPKEIGQSGTDDHHQKPYAYYTIRERLRDIMRENENARFIVTGHSLGGALAILFLAILIMHVEKSLLNRVTGVYTFGQPRVGDDQFGKFMKEKMRSYSIEYYRFVYANDMVPRLPYDDKTLYYKHFGPSLYYNSCYKGQVLEEEPNKNYFSLLWVLPKYLNAAYELIRSLMLPWAKGADYKEGWFEILFRVIGLVVPGLSNHGPQDYNNITRLGSGTPNPALSINGTSQLQQGLKDD